MSKGVVAVVGRPNVGKSSFFNFLAGQRISIVDDTPGVTRDRIYCEVEWLNSRFTLIDTGGIEPHTDNVLLKQMRQQAELAIETADVILFMVDVKVGQLAADLEIATMLRKSRKPVLVAVNKCDHVGEMPAEVYEFYQLGFSEIYPISATHGLGIGELLDGLLAAFPKESLGEEEEARIKVCLIGKPNAGKSSLTNRLLGQERSIVSPLAGTTRDALDSPLDNEFGRYTLIDTAGLRKKSRMEDNIERYSALRSVAAIEKSDVCLILIDGIDGITEQDTKVAGFAHNAGKASIFLINKWDGVEKTTGTMEYYTKVLRDRFPFMSYAPLLFISALTGQRCHKIFPLVNEVYAQAGRKLGTGVLNELMNEAQAMVPAPQDKGRRLKIQYSTQIGTHPPEFLLFCNDKELMHFSYERYLENQLRRNFGFEGTPIRFVVKSREKHK